jgi:hypothetical protein
LSRFLSTLRLSLKPNIFDGCVEARSMTLLLKPDLFRRVLTLTIGAQLPLASPYIPRIVR